MSLAPDILYNPQLCLEKINIANCSDRQILIDENTTLISFTFPAPQILGIFRKVEDILSDFTLDQNVVNFHFLKSTADCISKIGTDAYVRDLVSYKARVHQARKKKVKPPSALPPPPPPNEEDVFHLDTRSQSVVLQAMTLLNGLLKKNFSCTPADMKALQLSDLKLRAIYEQVQDESKTNNKFIIINQILFKKTKFDSHIFCSPQILCKEIVFSCHNKSGFHFKIPQLTSLLKPLIFHPDLDAFIKHTVQTCFICTISQQKRIRNLVGARRSNFYTPSQCLVIDSAYLPRSAHGYSKALIIIDSCTGYTIVYPSTSLQADAVKKHLQMYICSHPIPAEIKVDMGTEFRKGLDSFLAKYNIALNASKAYSKGSTSNAESAIRLVKSALRQLCLSHTANWQNCYLYLSKASIQQDFMGQVHPVPTFILVLTVMQTIFNWMAF